MRRLVITALGAAAFASASIANAAITVTGSTSVDTPITTVNGATQSTIDFGKNPEPAGAFNGSVDFSNTLAGLYSIIVSTSTPGATITNLSLTGISGTVFSAMATGATNSLNLLVPSAGTGNYRVTFAGNSPPGGSVATGNLTFQIQAVPEAGTWAMMIVGFGAMGIVLRRRRRPVLAQIA